jgi:hypothetical protein
MPSNLRYFLHFMTYAACASYVCWGVFLVWHGVYRLEVLGMPTGPAEVWVGLLLVVLVRPDDGLCARD